MIIINLLKKVFIFIVEILKKYSNLKVLILISSSQFYNYSNFDFIPFINPCAKYFEPLFNKAKAWSGFIDKFLHNPTTKNSRIELVLESDTLILIFFRSISSIN